eukprot:SAG31_NODE_3697_length_3978_cov_1.827791_1_plen_172_part_00
MSDSALVAGPQAVVETCDKLGKPYVRGTEKLGPAHRGLEMFMKFGGFDRAKTRRAVQPRATDHLLRCSACRISLPDDAASVRADASTSQAKDMMILKTDCSPEGTASTASSYAKEPNIRLVKKTLMKGDPHLWKPEATIETENKSAQQIREALAKYGIHVAGPPTEAHPEL